MSISRGYFQILVYKTDTIYSKDFKLLICIICHYFHIT